MKLIENLTLVFNGESSKDYFLHNYAMTADKTLSVETSVDATLELLLFKKKDYPKSLMKPV